MRQGLKKQNFAFLSNIFEAVWAFIKLMFDGFSRHMGPQNAASLTFATLLSLVPLMAVSLAIFYAFPIADEFQSNLQAFLFENFVPTSSEVLQQNLQAFSAKASKLSGVSFGFLIIVVLMMMLKIDKALNAIWEVQGKRRLMNRFLMYWSVLSLGPILIAGSIVATSYLVSLPLLSDVSDTEVGQGALALVPVLASTLAFSLMYLVIPNCRVRYSHALWGGFLAAVLFEVAKRGFGFYVTNFPGYEAIYGAMAAIPIFLVWVYLSWLVTLLGAEFTQTLRIFRWCNNKSRGHELFFTDAVQLLLLLNNSATDGKALSVEQLVDIEPEWREDVLEVMLSQMLSHAWVHQTKSGKWALARRLTELSLAEVLRTGAYHIPQKEGVSWPKNPQLAGILEQTNEQLTKNLDITLSQLTQ